MEYYGIGKFAKLQGKRANKAKKMTKGLLEGDKICEGTLAPN